MKDLKLTEKQKLRIQIRHKNSIEQFGYRHQALFWSSAEIQEIRFKVLLESIRRPVEGFISLLDVGCGFGDFNHYLMQHKQRVDYVGIDVSPDMVFSGRCQYPGFDLREGEIFDFSWSDGQFDWVVLSGALNEVVDETGDYARGVIREMFRLCKQGVVFNLLDARNAEIKHSNGLQSFYPDEMVAFCETLTTSVGTSVEWVDDYLDNDFTIMLRKV